MRAAERSDVGADLLGFNRNAGVRSEHCFDCASECGDERDYGRSTRYDCDSGFNRRIRIVGWVFHDVSPKIDFGDVEWEYKCDGDERRDTEPGDDGSGHKWKCNIRIDAGLPVDKPAGYLRRHSR